MLSGGKSQSSFSIRESIFVQNWEWREKLRFEIEGPIAI